MKQTLLTAEEMVRRYRKELKTVRIMRWGTLVVYVLFLWFMRNNVNMTLAIGSVVVFLLLMRMLQSMQTQQFALLQQVLNQECDSMKYTEIMELLEQDGGKNTAAIKLCRARGLYYSGRFEAAREGLKDLYIEKPSLGTAMLYHSIACDCALALNDLETARKEQQEACQLLNHTSPKQRGAGQQYMSSMDAAVALEEERYEEFFPLQKQVLSRAVSPLQKVTAMYRLALGELVQGEDAAAREHLEQVVEQGGTTFMAAEAESLLQEYALPESLR